MSCVKKKINNEKVIGMRIVFAALCIQFLTFGCVLSIGVYTTEFLAYFERSPSTVALIGSINMCVFFCAGPLSSFLLTKLSHMGVALIGAVVVNIGYIAIPFTPNIPYMICFYSVLVGLGSNMTFMSSALLAGKIFTEHQNLVQSVIKFGSGVGNIIMPMVFHNLIVLYGWKGSFYIVIGLNLHLFPLALLLKDVSKSHQIKANDAVDHSEDSELTPHRHDVIHGADTRIEVNQEPKHLQQCKIINCCHYMRHFLPFLSNIHFTAYLVSTILWNICNSSLVIFLAEIAVQTGFEKGDASVCLTLYGVGVTVGTLVNALVGTFFNRFVVNSIALLVGGITAVALSLTPFHTMAGLLGLSFLFGLTIGVIVSLMIVITTDILGATHMNAGFGLVILCNGLGSLAGPPVYGAVLEASASFRLPLYLIGGTMATGAMLLILVECRRRRK